MNITDLRKICEEFSPNDMYGIAISDLRKLLDVAEAAGKVSRGEPGFNSLHEALGDLE
jgi:hypothetical protein